MPGLSLRHVFIGIIATFVMDVLTGLSIKLGLIAPLSLIGRWFASAARGKVLHSDIGQVAPVHHELAIAVLVHYVIGIILALAYLLAMSAIGLSPHNPVAALGYEFAAVAAHVSGDGLWVVRRARPARNTIIRQ